MSNPIFERDGGCLICRSSQNLQLHHLIPRRFKSLEKDPRCHATLCIRCHESVERREKGFAQWKVSTGGSVDAGRLELFWEDFRSKGGIGGWKPSPIAQDESIHKVAVEVNATHSAYLNGMATTYARSGDDIWDFRATLNRIATDYVALAVLADRIKELKLYEPEFESFDDFLEDAKLERSKGFRLAQLGRYVRVSGATDQLPMARWNKLLPLIKFDGDTVTNAEDVKVLVDKAQVLNERDFKVTIQEAAHKSTHPDEPCPIAQDGIIHSMDGTLIGRVSRAWMGTDVVFVTLVIQKQYAKAQMEMKLI